MLCEVKYSSNHLRTSSTYGNRWSVKQNLLSMNRSVLNTPQSLEISVQVADYFLFGYNICCIYVRVLSSSKIIF